MSKATRGIDLTGHRILVAGAAGGIGQATALACAELGASVVLSDIAATDDLERQIRDAGGEAESHACDFGDRSAVEALGATIGDVDGIVATFGYQPFDDWRDEDWEDAFHKVMDVNVLGPLHLARVYLDRMTAQGGGRMVIVGSLAGRIGGLVSPPHYAASKGAVHSLVRWLARRGAEHDVLVNGIIPGPTDTPMMDGTLPDGSGMPMKRVAEAEEIAWPIAFLLTPGASYVSGALWDINGSLAYS